MGNSFENEIKELIRKQLSICDCNVIVNNSQLLKYIIRKTKPADKDESKARKSFASLYAIYVLVDDYINQGYGTEEKSGTYSKYEGAQYSTLEEKIHSMPFGQKIQNHALNNRMNDEFFGLYPQQKENGVYPIIRDLETKRYWINENYLIVKAGDNELNISCLILAIINRYIEVIKQKFEKFIDDCNTLQNLNASENDKVIDFIKKLLSPDVDARLFEIVSFSILKHYYSDRKIFWGYSKDELKEDSLKLYKTGRTNANDGGIDFVMKPLGIFFQVTETLDFKKYFLDIDKVERYPITFVVKSTETSEKIRDTLRKDAKNAGWCDRITENYMECIEDIINIADLESYLNDLNNKGKIPDILEEMIIQSKVEYNYVDID